MKHFTVTLCLSLILTIYSQAAAARCNGIPEADIVWCDDFDNYCVGAATWPGYPPFPAKCATDGSITRDTAAFLANWSSECPDSMGLFDEDTTSQTKAWNLPLGSVYLGNYNDPITVRTKMQMWDFTAAINAKEAGKTAVNGTDADPLILRFWTTHNAGTACKSPFYMELSLDGDHAPTDYVWADCSIIGEGQGPYPVVCQADRRYFGEGGTPIPNCPPLDTTVEYKALAFGMFAQLDPWPCDVDTGRSPTLNHPAIFDGNKWTQIRASIFPGIGDFTLDNVTGMWLEMEIKTSTFIFREESVTCAAGWCYGTAPRVYLGAFNTISMGTAPGCELDPATGNCLGAASCYDYAETGDEAWKHTYVDTPVLWGGELGTAEGACCWPDLTCSVTDSATCLAGNGTFAGSGTTCAEVECCPDFWPDRDNDGDVDQTDFGYFQACYSGTVTLSGLGCSCYDRDDNDQVDGTDFTAFTNCFTGADVPFVAASYPSCVP